MLDEQIKDYSHLYRNFYDIFVGHHIDQKGFDLNFAVRDTRNVYASFVNLMENNILMQNKHKFDKNPLERGYSNALYGKDPNMNHFSMIGKNLNELEAQYRGGLPNASDEAQNQK